MIRQGSHTIWLLNDFACAHIADDFVLEVLALIRFDHPAACDDEVEISSAELVHMFLEQFAPR